MKNLSSMFIATSQGKTTKITELESMGWGIEIFLFDPLYAIGKSRAWEVKGTRTVVARRRRETAFLCKFVYVTPFKS